MDCVEMYDTSDKNQRYAKNFKGALPHEAWRKSLTTVTQCVCVGPDFTLCLLKSAIFLSCRVTSALNAAMVTVVRFVHEISRSEANASMLGVW